MEGSLPLTFLLSLHRCPPLLLQPSSPLSEPLGPTARTASGAFSQYVLPLYDQS
jgi:hypothetical protein